MELCCVGVDGREVRGDERDIPDMPNTEELETSEDNNNGYGVEFQEPDLEFTWEGEDLIAYVEEYVDSDPNFEVVNDNSIYWALAEHIEIRDSNETTYLDAEAIKLYNGGIFIEFDREEGDWEVTEYATWEDEEGNTRYNYYVEDICNIYTD